jgi:translocation protein SEC72
MMFKQKEYAGAIEKYSISASIAVQRPAWEAQQIMREELSAVLSNRSAASCEAGDYIGALVDADHVIELKRNWTKGHFRKAKALIGLGHLEEARDAVDLGLAFEPNNPVRCFALAY